MTKYFVYCVIVRVILFIIQKASKPYLSLIPNEKFRGFLEQLVSCDLCLGVWLYALGAWLLNVNVLYEYVYVPVSSEIITGIITSFLVWLIKNGFDSQFRIIWVKPQE